MCVIFDELSNKNNAISQHTHTALSSENKNDSKLIKYGKMRKAINNSDNDTKLNS